MKQKIGLTVLVLLALSVFAQTGFGAESYLDMTLERAVAVALEKNRDIATAKDETVRAGFQITEAASAAYPQVTGLWDYNKNLKPQVFVISFPDSNGTLRKNRLKVGTDNTMNLGANLTQPIWVGGKVGTALKAAKIYKKISDKTYETVQQGVVTGVATAFNGILFAEEMVAITRSSLSIAEKHLDNVQKLYEAGSATEYDRLRARVNVANIKPDLLESENNVKIFLLRFKDMLGVDPDAPLTVEGQLSYPDTTLFVKSRPSLALAKRPEFKAAELSIDLYKKGVRLAFGDFLPTLSAGTTFAYSGNFDIFKYEAQDWNPYWFANVNLTFPIFTGFKNYAKYQQAKVDHRRAQIDYRKTRDSITIEVSESEMNLKKAVKKIEGQQMNVSEATKAVEMAESLFTNGRATQLEVLDAQLALEVSRTNLAAALYDAKVAEISLKKSLGLFEVDTKKGAEL